MRYDAVMFDLDGTLADTLRDLAEAANHALTTVGRPTNPLDAYRTLTGQGLDRLIGDAMGLDHQQLFKKAVEAFHDHYAQHRYDHCTPYPGIPELLDALTARGVRLAVMSNKPNEATVDMVERIFGRWKFAAVRGHRAGYPVKPDPKAALDTCSELCVPPERWAYIGDTDVDMHTGRSAGFFTVGVAWGFRPVQGMRAAGANAIIDQPSELLPLIR
ncbi:MAG: HAD family hydrolase [Planctomycetota bacterium]